MKEYETLVKSLKNKGFSVPCASDIAGYLISCLTRPAPSNLSGIKKDIDDVISALEELKKTIE